MKPILDLSSWQPGINWRAVPADDYEGAIVKVSEADDYYNDEYRAQIAGARAIGWEVGHYLFARLEQVAALREIAYFMLHADIRDGEPVFLDVEEIFRDSRGNARVYDISDLVLERLETLEKALGFTPGIYTYPWYKNAYGLNDQRLVRFPLWYAQVEPPTWPLASSVAPWPDATLHQYTTSLQIPGIPGESVDASTFKGDRTAFRALGHNVQAVAPASAADPITGHTVHPYFAGVYNLALQGRPLGPACAYTDSADSFHPGYVRQLFENCVLGGNGRGLPRAEGLGQAYQAATGKTIADWPAVHPLLP